MRSHATTAVMATPAIIGTPIAITPAAIMSTLSAIDQVVARRTPLVIELTMCQLLPCEGLCLLPALQKAALLEFLECLPEFGLRIHDNRAIPRYWLLQRPP